MKHTLVIALGLALVLPLSAEEAPAKPKAPKKSNPQAVFKKKDKDGDGFLTKEEFTAKAKNADKAGQAFARKDKNSDGKLSPEEFATKARKKNK